MIGEISVEKLIAAIVEMGKAPESYKDACLNQANNFDTKIFIEKIKLKLK